MSVEFWKSVFDVATVALLFLTFAAGAGVLITGNIINTRQEKQLHTFDSDLTSAKTDLAVQQERAATADSKVAGLEKDVASAGTEMAKQQERAARAELSLLELQKKLDWREIPAIQRTKFLAASIFKRKGIVTIIAVSSDAEAKAYAEKLQKMLKEAGWDSPPITTGLLLSPNDVGLRIAMVANVAPTVVSDSQVSIPSDSPIAYGFDLIAALDESGFAIASHGIQKDAGKENEVVLTVGSKP